jgi:ATP synthase subunit C.
MTVFKTILLVFPIIFLIISAFLANRSVQNGKKPMTALKTQVFAMLLVAGVCFCLPIAASAAAETATAASNGLGLIASALAVGITGIGGGIAVGPAAAAAIGATSEDPQNFGKAIIFVALGEGIALYGLLIAILILLTKV